MQVGIIGAGIAGLMAAGALAEAGHGVVLVDKGRSPGGRLATRRIGGARLDHGAQFFTVRTDRFAGHVGQWLDAGVVTEWCRGFDQAAADGFARYACPQGMNALAKHLAVGLDVRCGSMAFAVGRGAVRDWSIVLDDASVIEVDAAIVTTPVPQAFALLVSSGVTVPEELVAMEYDRTIALLTVLDRPGSVPLPGGLQHPDDTFGFIADNAAKGISQVPAITFHANARWSEEHWLDRTAAIDAALRALAEPWLGRARIVEAQVKKWRFATPRTPWPEPCWHDPASPTLLLAGDAFAGPRIEGAALSGLAAADALIRG